MRSRSVILKIVMNNRLESSMHRPLLTVALALVPLFTACGLLDDATTFTCEIGTGGQPDMVCQ